MRRKNYSEKLEVAAREERRRKVGEMYAQGYVMWPIAKLLGVDVATISRDLEVVRKEWLEQRTASYDEHMQRQLIGIEMQESQLWEAWYRSCQLETVTTKTAKKQLIQQSSKGRGRKGKQQDDSPPQMVVVEENEKTVTRQGIGDPRFMSEITRLRELRCKLLGLLEDEKPTSPIINIWQQLEQSRFDRDKDEIEDRITAVKQLPPLNQVVVRPIDDAGLKDVSGWKDVPDKPTDDNKIIPPDDTPLDID